MGVQNFEFQNFGGFSVKLIFFWGYEDFADIFWGSSQNLASLRVISSHFRVFFKVKGSRYIIGIFLGVVKISNIFGGLLKFLIFFLVKGRCWAFLFSFFLMILVRSNFDHYTREGEF